MRRCGVRVRALATVGMLSLGLILAPAAAAQREHLILVKPWNVVDPGDLTIARGDRVQWLNTTGRPFSLVFDRVLGAPDTPLVIMSEYAARFDRPGTYRYLVLGMGRGGAFDPGYGVRPKVIPAAASSGIGWVTVK